MKVLVFVVLSLTQLGQPSPYTAADCHRFIGISVKSDFSHVSLQDMGGGRKLLDRCLSEHGEQLSKVDLMGAFVALELMDNEISRRMKIEVSATEEALNKAAKECK